MNGKALFIKEFAKSCAENNINFAFENRLNLKIKKFTYQDLRETMNIFCGISFKILYILYGFLQFSIIWDYFLNVFHTDNIISFLISLILGFFPFIGTICGIYGADICLNWSLFKSGLVFILPYFIVNGPIIMIILFEVYKDVKRWRIKENIKI